MPTPELIFVYNADASIFGVVTDFVHKAISPSTYQCNLCKITHSNFGIKKEWQSFIQNLPYKTIFLHKDEFLKTYPSFDTTQLPAVFILMFETLQPLIPAKTLNKLKSIPDLINKLQQELDSLAA